MNPGAFEPVPGARRPRLGISSCLLGSAVRADGGDQRDDFLLETFGQHVEWVPVCPEVEIGLGTPREALRLVRTSAEPRLVGAKSGTERGVAMRDWAAIRLEELALLELDGFVLKSGSPSCGLRRVPVYDERETPTRVGQGVFARQLIERFPLLPVEEDERLHDPTLRETFIERLFMYERWTRLRQDQPTPEALTRFNTSHRLTLMAHDLDAPARLDAILTNLGTGPASPVFDAYGQALMATMALPAAPRNQAQVLLHVGGLLAARLDGGDRAELQEAITRYRQGLLPLIVPITLIRQHVRRGAGPDWLRSQTYLDSDPGELLLRYHA